MFSSPGASVAGGEGGSEIIKTEVFSCVDGLVSTLLTILINLGQSHVSMWEIFTCVYLCV